MPEKHVHYNMILKYAEGHQIESRGGEGSIWNHDPIPGWFKDYEYRVKRPRWQQELIDAAKEGKEVEILGSSGWRESNVKKYLDKYVFLLTEEHYRIKPDEEVIRRALYIIEDDFSMTCVGTGRVTRDPKTRSVKNLEIIKN